MKDQELLELPVDIIQRQIDVLNSKMDRILGELEYQRQQRMAREDLESDLLRVGNEMYKTAQKELAEYSETINEKEFRQLVWNLARNLKNINKVVLQMESGMAFLEDTTPIMRQIVIDLTARLDEWDRKGYFTFLRTSSEEISRILQTVDGQEIHTTAEKLSVMLDNMKNTDWSQLEQEKVSLRRLFKELRSPEVKKAIAVIFLILKAIMRQPEADNSTASKDKENRSN